MEKQGWKTTAQVKECESEKTVPVPVEVIEFAVRRGLSVAAFRPPRGAAFWLISSRASGLELGSYVPATRWYRAGSTRGQSSDWREVLGVFRAEVCRGRGL